MKLYRITKTEFARDFSGEGARRFGGRWNLKGVSVIYTADSAALATLESVVNSPLKIVPKNRSVTVFNIPDEMEIHQVDISKLPKHWRSYPAPIELAEIGTDWIHNKGVLALKVPSVILPDNEGWNIVLNPLHSRFREIEIISTSPYQFDQRLFTEH